MSKCKYCGDPIEWAQCGGKFIPLEPLDSHRALPLKYIGPDQELRADHRDAHGSAVLQVRKLRRPVQPEQPGSVPVGDPEGYDALRGSDRP
jgi:hypothetical protein